MNALFIIRRVLHIYLGIFGIFSFLPPNRAVRKPPIYPQPLHAVQQNLERGMKEGREEERRKIRKT